MDLVEIVEFDEDGPPHFQIRLIPEGKTENKCEVVVATSNNAIF